MSGAAFIAAVICVCLRVCVGVGVTVSMCGCDIVGKEESV